MGVRAFVSYAYDSPQHKNDVRVLAELLMANGVETELDLWAETQRRDWYAWAHRNITKADYTLVVASPKYKAAGDGHAPPDENLGVQAESAVLRDLVYRDRRGWIARFLPIVLPGHSVDEIPDFLQPFSASHYCVSELTNAGIEDLLRIVTRQPTVLRPPLGPVPMLAPRVLSAPRTTTSTRSTEPRWRVLPTEVSISWRANIMGDRWMGQWPATLEVHLAPVDDKACIPIARLRAVGGRLTELARSHNLLPVTDLLDLHVSEQVVWVNSHDSLDSVVGGIAVLRNGQRSAWMTLPKAQVLWVLAREDATSKISTMLSALLSLDLPLAEEAVPTVGVDPAAQVRVGGTRDSTSGSSTAPPRLAGASVRLPAQESLRSAEIPGSGPAVAEKLVQRLLTTFPTAAR